MGLLDRAVAAASAFVHDPSKPAEPSPPREVAPPREVEVHVAGLFITAGQLRAIGANVPADVPDDATCHGVLSLADATVTEDPELYQPAPELVALVSITVPGHVEMLSVDVAVSVHS